MYTFVNQTFFPGVCRNVVRNGEKENGLVRGLKECWVRCFVSAYGTEDDAAQSTWDEKQPVLASS